MRENSVFGSPKGIAKSCILLSAVETDKWRWEGIGCCIALLDTRDCYMGQHVGVKLENAALFPSEGRWYQHIVIGSQQRKIRGRISADNSSSPGLL